jgi:hypothetical protein
MDERGSGDREGTRVGQNGIRMEISDCERERDVLFDEPSFQDISEVLYGGRGGGRRERLRGGRDKDKMATTQHHTGTAIQIN